MSNNLRNWKIPDPLFYPLGLFNNSSRHKTVFVTWSHSVLLTFIFKKSGNSNSLKDTYKILLQGTIQDIIIMEFNTLCLTTTGYVYYFSSCKSLKRLQFLDSVRCMTATSNGFAIIRITEENRIILEIYCDFSKSSEMGRTLRSFDISFDDENLFNSSWKGEKFCIHCIQITPQNRNFLEIVAKQNISGAELFLFTINNSLFGLLEDRSSDEEFQIFLIHTLPSEIESIKFLPRQDIILILMKCGVLEMIFYSKLSKSLDRAIHTIDSELLCFTVAEKYFFYSDDSRVVRCKLSYDDNRHTISVEKVEKITNGVVALTWVSSMRKLICLTENNIFYRLKFDEEIQEIDADEFVDVTVERIKEIRTHFRKLANLVDEPNRIRKQIRFECHKQEIMNVYKHKDIYENLVEARVSFSNIPPACEGLTVYPMNEQILTKNSYFAVVEIQIKSNPIFKQDLWTLSIQSFGDKYIIRNIPIKPTLLNNTVTVLLQIEKTPILIIPEIRVSLASHIKVGTDLMYVSLPVKIHNVSYNNLFTSSLRTLVNPNHRTVEEKIFSFIKNKDPSKKEMGPIEFSSQLKTPLLISLEDLYETFGVAKTAETLSHNFVVYFLGVKLNVEYIEHKNFIEIKSNDPGALYWAKLTLARTIYSEVYNIENNNVQNTLYSLQKLRAELSGRNFNSLELRAGANIMRKIYFALRKGVLTRN